MIKNAWNNTLRFGWILHWIACLLIAPTAIAAESAALPWISIDTQALTLTVHSGRKKILARFRNIAIGSGGTASMRLAGDATTPLGNFHIAWVNYRSSFEIFFGLDFPTPDYGERAYRLGLIDAVDLQAIVDAARNGTLPPQRTALGGNIGIHGLGGGDPLVQQTVNWTNGCIALTNADVKKLAQWIRIGSRVEIL